MRRVQSRLNTQERKRDTRWKILIGGTFLARVAQDPNAADRLDRMMDEVLTEDRDRQLLERWRGLRRHGSTEIQAQKRPELGARTRARPEG